MEKITDELKKIFAERLKENEPLAKYTNFRLGGPARFLAEARTVEEVKQALRLAKDHGVPVFVLGGGSNTLASDAGFLGLILKMGMREIRIDGTRVYAQAGAISAAVARQASEAGLEGFEWAISLPGTIGGAVRGNAGCYGGEVKDVLETATVLRDGEIVELTNKDLRFGYRESAIKHSSDIVLSATLLLRLGDASMLKERMKTYLEKRKASQPLYAGSAGCVFKNCDVSGGAPLLPPLPPAMKAMHRAGAGWLIEQAGLKGAQEGGARISEEHGNFVINAGGATASDVKKLISRAKREVQEKFGVALEEEVQYLGDV